jgi:hypothetical protein
MKKLSALTLASLALAQKPQDTSRSICFASIDDIMLSSNQDSCHKMKTKREAGGEIILRLDSPDARYELKALAASQHMTVQALVMTAIAEYKKARGLRT